MAKVAWAIPRFNTGEMSPLMGGRIDYEARQFSCISLENAHPLIQGPLRKRGGTRFVGEAKYPDKKTRLIEFEYAADQAYILEFGDLYIRVYKNKQLLKNDEGIMEIVSPYTEDDLKDIWVVQNKDVLFIAHEKYPPKKLIRMTQTSFVLSEFEFVDGPYLPKDTRFHSMTPAAVSGTNITMTASYATFTALDVGRHMRLEHKSGTAPNQITKMGWCIIKEYVSPTVVKVDIKENFGATSACLEWRFGAFSNATAWPSNIGFFEQRLIFAGDRYVAFSKTTQYETFSPTEIDGTVKDNNGLFVEIAADSKAHEIKWICDGDVLFVGAMGADFIITSNSLQDSLTPSNVKAKRISNYGSESVRPIKIDDCVLFVQRMSRKVRAFIYSSNVEQYQGLNITSSANHITKSGIIDSALTQEPDPIVWYIRNDGTLIGCLFDREQSIVAWHHHIIGGSFGDGNSYVESIASIQSDELDRDDLYMIVKRTINGETKRYIEVLTRGIDDEEIYPSSAFFVDCGITKKSEEAFKIVDGLEHLNGQYVDILSGGNAFVQQKVVDGQITLEYPSRIVHVGLHYEPFIEISEICPPDDNGTSEGKEKIISACTFRLYKTLGVSARAGGATYEDTVPFRRFGEAMDKEVPLFTGDKKINLPGGYSNKSTIVIKQDLPLPLTVLGIFPTVSINKL